MTTVVDPTGTPVPVYNRGGMTIVFLIGGDESPPTPIPHVSGHTVVVTTPGMDGNNYELPTNAEIGDVVEIRGNGVDVRAAVGESVRGAAGGGGGGATGVGFGTTFRKISATEWI